MRFDWAKLLTVAQELVAQVTALLLVTPISSLDEAKLRSGISRAYYGSFRTCRDHLRDKDGYSLRSITQGNTHQIVIDLFDRSNDPNRQKIAGYLRDLRSARNKADYDDFVPDLLDLARNALLQSEQVLTLLKTL